MVPSDNSVSCRKSKFGLRPKFFYCIFILTYLIYLSTKNIAVRKCISETEKASFHLYNVPFIAVL